LTDLMVYSNITRYKGPESLSWELRPQQEGDAARKTQCSDACKRIVEKMLQRDPKNRINATSAYKDKWFVDSGVVWSKIAKGDPSFTNDETDPFSKVPLAAALAAMEKEWHTNAELPKASTYVDSEDWFADF